MATELIKVTFPTGDYITRNESSLTWGGANLTGSYGCIDAALMDELGANRFQFIKASAITVEYSRDNGETWTDYGATDAQKQQIFAQGGGLVIGKADSTHKATEHPGQYQLRITIDTGVAGVYSYLNKFVIYVSTNNSGNCSCKIQKALQSTPTAVSLPTYTVTNEVLTIGAGSVTAGTAASLSYTAKSIPNVTSVGSAPTLGTAINVVTGFTTT